MRGYTLIEMLVIVAIIAIVMPALMNVIVSLYSSRNDTFARAAALIEATHGVNAIVRDVRASVYSESGALPIVSFSSDSLTLYADTDFDGRVERVRYFLDGTVVRRGIIEPTSSATYPSADEIVDELAKGVVNADRGVALFHYYDADGNELTQPSEQLSIRRISAELVTVSSLARQQRDVSVRTSASIRNLKDTY